MSVFGFILVRIWENTDQNNFEYGDFLRSIWLCAFLLLLPYLLRESFKSSSSNQRKVTQLRIAVVGVYFASLDSVCDKDSSFQMNIKNVVVREFQWMISLHHVFKVTKFSNKVKTSMTFIQEILLEIFESVEVPPKNLRLPSQESYSDFYFSLLNFHVGQSLLIIFSHFVFHYQCYLHSLLILVFLTLR